MKDPRVSKMSRVINSIKKKTSSKSDLNERTPLLRESSSWSTQTLIGRSNSKTSPDSPYLLPITDFEFWLIFGPILVQYFVAMFDSFLMVSSHPVITSYFNASNSASWLSTAFMLTSAALQPIFGRMSDMFGRRPVYLTALLIFAIGTGYCAAAQSIGEFIAGRAICGIGAGAMISMGNIIVNDLVKVHLRGTYQAYINLLYGGGATIGAAFGGFLCDRIGWRWTFFGQVPLILIVWAMAYCVVPNNLGPQLANDRPFAELFPELDVTGSCLLFCSVASLIIGLNFGGNVYSWTHPIVLSSLTLAFVTGALLLNVEKHAKRPILPLEMIMKAPRANIMFSNFFTMIGSNHILFNAPIYFQVVHGDTATIAGLRMSLPALCTTVCGLSAGIFLTYTGRIREPMVIGAFCMLAGGLATSMLGQSTPAWLGTLAIAPPYAGQGFLFPASILGLVATSSQDEQAVVMTTLILFRNLGIVLGVAMSSLILQNSLVVYMDRFITGANKQEIIEKLRRSVETIRELHGERKLQAIAAYSASLKLTFIAGMVSFMIVLFLVLPIELPKLERQKDLPKDDDEV